MSTWVRRSHGFHRNSPVFRERIVDAGPLPWPADVPAPGQALQLPLQLPRLPSEEITKRDSATQLTPLARAEGDKLNCAGLTREAAIELMIAATGIVAGIIREKLESGRKPNGPDRETVIAWLCTNKFAWRPKGASEARLTATGRAKAQSVLIHVSAGNY